LDADLVATHRLDAIIARCDRGPDAALAALSSFPVGASDEIEALRAGYFLDLGDEPQASSTLAQLPTSETEKPRVRRARLAAALLGKRRDEAIRLAEGLVTAASEDAMIAYTVAMTFVYASVPTEFWPGSLMVWAQPVPERELLPDPQQPARLRTATRLTEILLENDELDETSRGIVEVLKLSTLLYDRERRDEGRAYAQEILAS
jgi:hypothetical protein